MLLSRFLIGQRVFVRLKSTELSLIERINRIKPKDLSSLIDEEQITKFFQIKRALGGKFYSLEQLKNEPNIQIDFEQIIGHLSTGKRSNENQKNRIQIEPRLTTKTVAEIESVCSLDYTSSFMNWAIVKSTAEKNQFQIQQWNSLQVDLDRKFHFIKTFNQLSSHLSTMPLNNANVLLVDQPTYRFPNLKVVTYVSQLQQIRAVLNTLLHGHLFSKRPVYHISGRDVALHFGLFVGNEQSSAEFFLTNLIFHTGGTKQTLVLDMDDQSKMNFHQANKGQREPMAQCLLRAIAFLQCVNEKKDVLFNQQ